MLKQNEYFFRVILIALLAALTGCTSFTTSSTVKKSFAMPIEVRVTDPAIRQFTDITQYVKLVATGEFAEGTYAFAGIPVTFAPHTKFWLTITLPIETPGIISTRLATGTLQTSRAFTMNGVVIPKSVQLEKGRVSGYFDLVRTVGAFMISLVLGSTTDGDNVRNMISSLTINQAVLVLRPDSQLQIGTKSLHIGGGSSLMLRDVMVDKKLNCNGYCYTHLNFLKNCKWPGEKVDCFFDGGIAELELLASKSDNEWRLASLGGHSHDHILLKQCMFAWGKNKRSASLSDTCTIDLHNLKWEHTTGLPYSNMRLLGLMGFVGTHLRVKTDIHQTVAYFPHYVPATLSMTVSPKIHSTNFSTIGSAQAQAGNITVSKKSSNLVLVLSKATVGPIVYDKSGALAFQLDKGRAQLEQIRWQGNKCKLTLTSQGPATISIPQAMWLEKPSATQTTQLQLPVQIKVGSASFYGSKEPIELSDLSGKLFIDAHREVSIKSDLDFVLRHSALLGNQAADVNVRGLNLFVNSGQTLLELKHCHVLASAQALENAISREMPSKMAFAMNTSLVKSKTWRYRQARARRFVLDNLHILKIKPTGTDQFAFTAGGDAQLEGTVEKCGLTCALSKDRAKVCNWDTRPWTIYGHIVGSGTVKYKFLPTNGSLKSIVQYQLSMKAPVPANVDLDWTDVAGHLLGKAEKEVILKHLRTLTVPLKKEGEVTVFGANDPLWRNFKITQLAAKPSAQGAQINFEANAYF